MMLQPVQLRFAAAVLFAAAGICLTAASAFAFTQQFLQPGGDGKSTFADPDNNVTNSGQGAHPLGPNGPVVQFGVQQGPGTTTFGRFQGDGSNAPPPDPYYRLLGNGN
jgi:hypothetical protein